MIKHDQYVEDLINKLDCSDSRIHKNVEITTKKRSLAEIDLLVEFKGSIHIYEVKCSHRISKAKRQLSKIKKLVESQYRKPINLFFYNGGSKEIIKIKN